MKNPNPYNKNMTKNTLKIVLNVIKFVEIKKT